MLLSDSGIKQLISDGVLGNAEEALVGPVSYDLRTEYFAVRKGDRSTECELAPGESTFVAARETIALPDDITARVLLKNSRIRQGLALDAPLYFPGHKTRVFFRVTNVSADAIALDTARGIAQITFERLEKSVEHPYAGSFSDEMDFSGMGNYEGAYASEMRRIGEKKDELKGIERRMYGNVMAIMAIFAAIFTLVNVNMGASGYGIGNLLEINLATVGSFSALVALIAFVMGRGCEDGGRWRLVGPLTLAVVCFAAAFVVAVFAA